MLEEYQEILTAEHRQAQSIPEWPGMADSKGCRAGLHSAANQFAKLMKWTQGRSLRPFFIPIYPPEENP